VHDHVEPVGKRALGERQIDVEGRHGRDGRSNRSAIAPG
jgi:hypothetical protein